MMTVAEARERQTGTCWCLGHMLVAGLFVLHAGLLVDSSRENFVTVDEAAHLSAGLAHWETGDFTLYRVNPPLARMLGVVPVMFVAPDFKVGSLVDHPGWRGEFYAGAVFATQAGSRYLRILFAARLAGIAWSLLGAWVVYRWAGELFGSPAGILSLMLWCIGPTILAHAALLTPDVPASVAGLVATYAFWRYLRSPSWSAAGSAGLLLGVAQLTKFTLLLLYLVFPLLWLIHRVILRAPQDSRLSLRREMLQGTAITLISMLVINLGYGFHGSGQRLGDLPLVSRTFAGESSERLPTDGRAGNRFRGTYFAGLRVPVPADYVRGIDVQRRDFESGQYRSYLDGEWRFPGWWYWYLYALAIKVPLGTLGLAILGLTAVLWCPADRERWTARLTVWLPALATLGLVSAQSGFTNHFRYLLPAFPFAIIALGEVASAFSARPSWPAVLVGALLLGAMVSSLRTHPHSLSYFNELAGGPDLGHECLVDSNIDWGQDLLFLKKWLDEHPESRPLRLAYFNLIDPRVVGIHAELPPFGPSASWKADEPAYRSAGPQPGYYAASINYVHGHGLLRAPDGHGNRVVIPQHGLSYFRFFRPIAKAGYSIFIYRISPEEADEVRHQLGLPLLKQPPPPGHTGAANGFRS